MNEFKLGDRAYEAGDPEHVGTIERIGDGMVVVRWHKGYATWVPFGRLRIASA